MVSKMINTIKSHLFNYCIVIAIVGLAVLPFKKGVGNVADFIKLEKLNESATDSLTILDLKI